MANLKSIGIGAGGGVIASLCCTLPLAVVALGIGSVSVALAIAQYKLHFLAFSLLFLGATLGIYLKRNPPCCMVEDREKFVLTALVTYAAIYLLTLYAIAPAVAPYIYR